MPIKTTSERLSDEDGMYDGGEEEECDDESLLVS